ncbi:hypothetical protein IFM89_038685, partial [Coptis chinensis]
MYGSQGIDLEGLGEDLHRTWQTKGHINLELMDREHVKVVFDDDRERKHVIENGPWVLYGYIFSVKEWNRNYNFAEYNFEFVKFWVQIWDLPRDRINKANVWKIGAELGKVMEVDLSCPPEFNKPIARVRVELDIRERLSKDQNVKLETGETITVRLKYEKLEVFCFFCGVIGHDQYTCRIRAQHRYELLKCGGSPKDIKPFFTSQLRANQFYNGIAYTGKHMHYNKRGLLQRTLLQRQKIVVKGHLLQRHMGLLKLGAAVISSDIPEPSIDDLADQVVEVLNFFGLGVVMCLGVTAGAYVLTLFAIKYRQRVLGAGLFHFSFQIFTSLCWESSCRCNNYFIQGKSTCCRLVLWKNRVEECAQRMALWTARPSCCSEEAAKDAIIYSYKAAASGFSAKLTPEQVSQISIYMLKEQDVYAAEMEHTFIAIKPDGVQRGLVLEEIRLGLELNDYSFQQRRIAHMRFLGELYNYEHIDSSVIFETLYLILAFGHGTSEIAAMGRGNNSTGFGMLGSSPKGIGERAEGEKSLDKAQGGRYGLDMQGAQPQQNED